MTNLPERPETSRVSIEDLLRLKRAERPAPEFWGRFEQDLRAKQLAAIVEPRPWWIKMRLPQVGRAIARFQVPIGAAAAVALSFSVVREYQSLDGVRETSSLARVAALPQSPVRESVGGVTGDTFARNETQDSRTETAILVDAAMPVGETVAVKTLIESLPAGPGELLAMIPWTAGPQTLSGDSSAKPVILDELPQVYFASAIKPAGDHHFAGSVVVDPIAILVQSRIVDLDAVAEASSVSPREIRRNRILASLVVADNSTDADRARSGHSREIVSGDRLYDSVSRLGMGGDRLTLKF